MFAYQFCPTAFRWITNEFFSKSYVLSPLFSCSSLTHRKMRIFRSSFILNTLKPLMTTTTKRLTAWFVIVAWRCLLTLIRLHQWRFWKRPVLRSSGTMTSTFTFYRNSCQYSWKKFHSKNPVWSKCIINLGKCSASKLNMWILTMLNNMILIILNTLNALFINIFRTNLPTDTFFCNLFCFCIIFNSLLVSNSLSIWIEWNRFVRFWFVAAAIIVTHGHDHAWMHYNIPIKIKLDFQQMTMKMFALVNLVM